MTSSSSSVPGTLGNRALSITVSPEGGLQRYLTEIRKFPMLAKEEEVSLAERWRQQGDVQAAHRLVTSHLRLVAKIAMGYRGYGLPMGEVISEGNIGLMQAVKKFEPERGFRLATYAMWWIRAAIQEYVLRSWSLVKIGTTAAQKKLFFNLRRMKSQIQAVEGGELKPHQISAIAHKLAVTDGEVVEMDRRLTGGDASLNAPLSIDGDGEWMDWIADDRVPSAETSVAEAEEGGQRNELLEAALSELNERERHILRERRLKDEPTTLEDLAQVFNVSRERVRQIEVRAFEKLQASMMQKARERGLMPVE